MAHRRTWIAVVSVLVFIAPVVGRADANQPPNVLLILTDDHGFHLSAVGTPGLSTPNIDRLAAGGVLCMNAFAATASCSPSRASILTGMYPHANGLWRNTFFGECPPKPHDPDTVGIHRDLPTLVEILNRAGYVTAITTKFHMHPVDKLPFTRFLAGQPDAAVERFLKECPDQPFFLQANVSFPHRPFKRPGADPAVPDVDPDAVRVPPQYPDVPEMRRDWADYLTAVQQADAQVGRIIKALEGSGKLDNTLVLFAGDQGYPFHRAKASLYDAGIHVPLILRGPGVPASRQSTKLVSLIDLMPTILDFAGLPIPKTVQGRLLRPILQGTPDAAWREFLFAEHNAHGPADLYPCRSVTDGRMHYIRNLKPQLQYSLPADLRDGGHWDNRSYLAAIQARDRFPAQYDLLQATLKRPAEELYDLHTDPAELHNLIGDERYAAERTRLGKALDDWMAETQDPGDPAKIRWRQ